MKISLQVFGSLFLTFTLTSCEGVESQKAVEIFADIKDLPAQLEVLANPRPSEKMVARRIKFSDDNPGRVGVAVIDNGVDYTHPYLYKQIKFSIVDGKATGAGFDVLGRDSWASPSLIKANLLALVATKITDGRLVGVSGDPTKWLLETNDLFIKALLTAIKENKKLDGSLFQTKFTEKTLSIFGARALLENEKSCLKRYKERKEKKTLVSEKSATDPSVIKEIGQDAIDKIVKNDWLMDPEEGSPKYLPFCSTEGADAFLAVLRTSFESAAVKSGFEERTERYLEFRKAAIADADEDDLWKELQHAWHDLRFDYNSRNGLYAFAKSFCESAGEEYKQQVKAPGLSAEKKLALAKAEVKARLTLLRKGLGLLKATDKTKSTATLAEDNLKKTEELFDFVFVDKPEYISLLACDPRQLNGSTRDSGLAEFGAARFNPLLSEHSAAQTHGTHVAGVVARQDKRIDVVPVRVATATPNFSKELASKVRSDFEVGFRNWLKWAPVSLGVATRAAETLGSGQSVDLEKEITKYLDENFESAYLEFYFFHEILRAVKYVGDQKIKVANMSLGVQFSKSVFEPGEAGRDSRIENFVKFFIYEYFKYQVGSTIKNFAPHTLFVIASGNEGNWADGKSRSALPCDLSSPFFAKIETELKGKVFPNNQLNNILCVGSIDPNDEISSFMNLPLTDIPFVMSYGESVLSAIKMTDCEGAEQEVQEKFGKKEFIHFRLDEESDAMDSFFSEAGWVKETDSADSNKEDADAEDRVGLNRLRAQIKFQELIETYGTTLRDAGTVRLCRSGGRPRARLTGTSMASPAVAGFVGRVLAQKMEALKVSEAELYIHPEFAPKKIIEDIRAKSPAFGGQGILKDIPTVVDVNSWEQIKRDRPDAGRLRALPVIDLGRLIETAPKPEIED